MVAQKNQNVTSNLFNRCRSVWVPKCLYFKYNSNLHTFISRDCMIFRFFLVEKLLPNINKCIAFKLLKDNLICFICQ